MDLSSSTRSPIPDDHIDLSSSSSLGSLSDPGGAMPTAGRGRSVSEPALGSAATTPMSRALVGAPRGIAASGGATAARASLPNTSTPGGSQEVDRGLVDSRSQGKLAKFKNFMANVDWGKVVRRGAIVVGIALMVAGFADPTGITLLVGVTLLAIGIVLVVQHSREKKREAQQELAQMQQQQRQQLAGSSPPLGQSGLPPGLPVPPHSDPSRSPPTGTAPTSSSTTSGRPAWVPSRPAPRRLESSSAPSPYGSPLPGPGLGGPFPSVYPPTASSIPPSSSSTSSSTTSPSETDRLVAEDGQRIRDAEAYYQSAELERQARATQSARDTLDSQPSRAIGAQFQTWTAEELTRLQPPTRT